MCICSVILGELENYYFNAKLEGPQYYFPENFRCNLAYYESKNFTYSFFRHIFKSKNFRLPFFLRKI